MEEIKNKKAKVGRRPADPREVKQKILKGALEHFGKSGAKMNMDQLAKDLGVSKKTIYAMFGNKEGLMHAMVDYAFDRIRQCREEALGCEDLSIKEKIRSALCSLPEEFRQVDLIQMYQLREKVPTLYQYVVDHIQESWQQITKLLEEGVEAGVIRQMDFSLFQMVYEAAVERFITTDTVSRSHLKCGDASDELVEILLEGVCVK